MEIVRVSVLVTGIENSAVGMKISSNAFLNVAAKTSTEADEPAFYSAFFVDFVLNFISAYTSAYELNANRTTIPAFLQP